MDLRIEADKEPSSAESLVYLCAYNYYEWKPVAIGIQTDAVCEFKDVVGNNIFIIAEGGKEQELRYITAPFLVDSSGHIRKFIPDKNKLVTQELWIEKGKTPRNLHFGMSRKNISSLYHATALLRTQRNFIPVYRITPFYGMQLLTGHWDNE